MPQDGKTQIVIVGGGASGGLLARELSKNIDAAKHAIVLVTARPFSILLPASIRMTTTPDGRLEDRVLVPYDKLFYDGKGTVKIGRVAAVDARGGGGEGSLVLTNGERVYYDILVLAPGNKWSGPLDFPDSKDEVLTHIRAWRDKFAAAKSVLLAGGGPVGIEYAGEVKEYFPKTKATIVHREKLLLNGLFPDKFRRRAEADIRSVDVKVILNDSVDVDLAGPIPTATAAGEKLEADLVVPSFGGRPATDFLRDMGEDVLSSSGHIRVRKTLQLLSHPNIFAMGDAIETTESRQIVQAQAHVPIVVANIRAQLNGQDANKEYKGALHAMLITNGKSRGVFYIGVLWGIVLGNWAASRVKGRDLLINQGRASYGATAA